MSLRMPFDRSRATPAHRRGARPLEGGETAIEELRAVNRVNDPIPAVAAFHELILAQAASTPERIAVVWEDQTQSYGELVCAAARLANELVARGVGRGVRVGVAVGRNAHLLEATLGVLMAGAAYVPLDPDYPSERLTHMIEDARIRLVLSERAVGERLPRGEFETLFLDEAAPSLRARSPAPPELSRDPTDIAYVIYTSGSTGRPKGVQIPHGAVVNFLHGMAQVPGCTAEDRLVAVTTLSFDIAVLELFLPLTTGARTIIASRECLLDGARLAELIARHDATLMQATPTTWQLLIDAGWTGRPGFTALCGGEAFPRRLLRELLPRCAAVWNMYGPTETTVWSTCQRLTDADAPILVGTPIANTQVYVLDSERQLVPFGVCGELYIGGRGVAAGYLDRPELTRERFVPDPFSPEPGARLYRTGDLARLHPEGLEIVGRVDHQVKLRGHRIELGEIEAALEAVPEVQRAAVVVRDVGADDRRLVAYATRAGQTPLDATRLRATLGERLPAYMVPQHFIELPRLPLTPNGKIDRNALPGPEDVANRLEASPHEPAAPGPTDAVEALLLGLWQRLLRVPDIGLDDDFFELGGHSLLAVRLVQSINETCRTSLPAGVVFQARTIRSQAALIDSGEPSHGPIAVPLQQGAATPLFCICGIGLYQPLARHLEGRTVYGIFVPAEQSFFEAGGERVGVRELARQYAEVIVETHPKGPYQLAGISFGGGLAYEIAQQLRAAGHTVGLVAILDTVLDGAAPSAGPWTTERLIRAIRRAPRHWLARGRALMRRGLRAAAVEARRLARQTREHIRSRLGTRAGAAAVQPGDDRAEIARLHALRERHYEQAWRDYQKTLAPFDGEVVVFRARDAVRAASAEAVGEDCGWSRHVPAHKLQSHTVPGDHLGILEEPNVTELARLLGRYLDRSERKANADARPLAAE